MSSASQQVRAAAVLDLVLAGDRGGDLPAAGRAPLPGVAADGGHEPSSAEPVFVPGEDLPRLTSHSVCQASNLAL